MQFFRYFPSVTYDLHTDDLNVTAVMTNITAHVRLMQRVRDNISVFYDYVVQDGERPDSVATKVYGSPNYTWIVLVLNGIMSLFDWPLTNDEFVAYITERYGSVANAQAQIVYRTVDGYEVDATTFATLTTDQQGEPTTKYDQEFEANETKRTIKVVPRQFLPLLVNQLKQVMA